MGRELDWIMPMLETDSIEVLSMRQDIIYCYWYASMEKCSKYIGTIKN